jgi:hypothetical protein
MRHNPSARAIRITTPPRRITVDLNAVPKAARILEEG